MTTTNAVVEEKTFFSDNQVQVTSARIVFPSVTYALRNVSSVRKLFQKPSKVGEIILILFGLFLLMIGLVAKSAGVDIFSILLIALGIFLITQKKIKYFVMVGTNAGDQKGLVDTNETRIDSVVNAINQAIIERP